MSYNELEKEFREKHPNGKFMKRYIIITIGIIAVLTFIKTNIFLKIMFSIFLPLTIMYAFICKKLGLKFWKVKPWEVLTKYADELTIRTGNKNKDVIKQLLINRNLLTKEKVQEMREYYSNNVDKPSKPNMFEIITGIASIAISIYFSINAKEEIAKYILDGLVIVFWTIIISYTFKDIKDLKEILFDKYDVNDIFERALSEIYLEL